MIEKQDREYIGNSDYCIPLGRIILEENGYRNRTTINCTADRLYSFSNENIFDYLKKYDLKGKKIATVGSSGDQVFNAIMLGANDITFIDANPVARYYVELKIAAIKNLTFEEMLNYFTNENILNYKYYAKISHDLSKDAQIFWDSLMLEIDKGNRFDIHENLFHSPFSYGQMANSYLQNISNFHKLKKLLDNVDIKFIWEEFRQFTDALGDEKFDYILLSNVCDYVASGAFNKITAKLYNNNLNNGGAIQINYNFANGRLRLKDFKDLLSNCPDNKFRRILVRNAGDFNFDGNTIDHSYASSEFLEKF